MTQETVFRIHLVFGYIAWLLCFSSGVTKSYYRCFIRSIDQKTLDLLQSYEWPTSVSYKT